MIQSKYNPITACRMYRLACDVCGAATTWQPSVDEVIFDALRDRSPWQIERCADQVERWRCPACGAVQKSSALAEGGG